MYFLTSYHTDSLRCMQLRLLRAVSPAAARLVHSKSLRSSFVPFGVCQLSVNSARIRRKVTMATSNGKAAAIEQAVQQPIAPEAGKDGGAPAPLNEGNASAGPATVADDTKTAAREGEQRNRP
jgi:hypothetical protein